MGLKREQQQLKGGDLRPGTLTLKVDYLEGTVPTGGTYGLLNLLGDVEPLSYGFRGYERSGLVAGGRGRLAWNDDEQRSDAMGMHFSLGAQALAHLAAVDERWANLSGVLRTVRGQLGGHVTRIDLAWDDKTEGDQGVLDLDVLRATVDDDSYTSRWKGTHDDSYRRRTKDGVKRSATLYLGEPSSDARLRCYDKRKERLQAGDVDAVQGVGHWVRVELELRRERADAAAKAFQDADVVQRKVFRFLSGVLKGYIDFKVPNPTDSNKRRWATAPWWTAFLAGVAKAKLEVLKVQRTLADVQNWLVQATAPSLAMLEQVHGNNAWVWLYGVAEQGRARLGPRHRAILRAAAAGGAT